MELSSLSACTGLCSAVIAAGKHLANEHLSAKQKRILGAACHREVVELVKHDGFFEVFAEGMLFVGKHRMVCAAYLDAFRGLCELLSLVSERDSVFALIQATPRVQAPRVRWK